MLCTFPKIVRQHLEAFDTSRIYPEFFNSDAIENVFCQQRTMYNGPNTNPTYGDYCTNTNSIILSQSLVCKGKKTSNVGISDAALVAIEPLPKKQKTKKKS